LERTSSRKQPKQLERSYTPLQQSNAPTIFGESNIRQVRSQLNARLGRNRYSGWLRNDSVHSKAARHCTGEMRTAALASLRFEMGPNYVYLYLTAMRDEAMTASHAYSRIEECVHKLSDVREATAYLFTEDGDEDAELAVALENDDFLEIADVEEDMAAAIEAFLSAQARLSLFISPSPVAKVRSRAQQRAAALRARLRLTEKDDLGDRGLRNAWMHIDESIDSYVFEKASAPNLIVRHVGIADKGRKRVLRLIDPSGLNVWLLGEEYSLRELYDWIDDLNSRLDAALQDVEHELHGSGDDTDIS
jgi:hypothetical protein